MKPTDEQIKEFWERCGLVYYPECECINGKGICWGMSSDTYGKDGKWHFTLPELDLNNLFKFAVSGKKRLDRNYLIEITGVTLCPLLDDKKGGWWCDVNYNYCEEDSCADHDVDGTTGASPELALFWAIYSIITSGKE